MFSYLEIEHGMPFACTYVGFRSIFLSQNLVVMNIFCFKYNGYFYIYMYLVVRNKFGPSYYSMIHERLRCIAVIILRELLLMHCLRGLIQ